jgi:hypothetical protein
MESSRELKPVVREPGHINAGQSAISFTVGEIRRGQREGMAVVVSVFDEDAADRVCQVHPLMQVKGQRIRPFHPGNEMSVPGSDGCPGTERTIDMESAPLLGADISDTGKIIDGPGIGGPGDPDDADGEQPVLPVVTDRRFQGRQIHFQEIVHGHPAQ